MSNVYVTRLARIPDPVRVDRYRRAPELGPQILFFSGGTAINTLSRVLKIHTYNSTHMVTPFDSGGSSAALRQAFHMPAIGDLRSRLMALADETVTGHPEVYQLFTYRLPMTGRERDLLRKLKDMADGRDPMVSLIPNPMRRLIRHQLGYFLEAMPKSFDLHGASIGNLILAGGYLNNFKHLDPIIFLFSKLVEVHGTVRAIVNDDLHLGADLEDGTRVMGQHRITGKEEPPLTSAVKRLFLSAQPEKYVKAKSFLRKKNRELIKKADLIVFPPGSFYTSILANLLPKGVGTAIAASQCPKVYIPNLGQDPEQVGMTTDRMVLTLLEQLRLDLADDCDNNRLLNFVLIDSKNGVYPSPLSEETMKELGIQVVDVPMVSKQSAPYYDAALLANALLSLT